MKSSGKTQEELLISIFYTHIYAKNCPHRQKNTVRTGAYTSIIGEMEEKAKDFIRIM